MLAHPILTEPFDWKDRAVNTLVVEDPVQFRTMARDLMNQAEGMKGDFVLSVDDTPVEMAKHAEIITDVYRLDPAENKRICTALQKEAAMTAINEIPDLLAGVYGKIAELMSDLIFRTEQDAAFDEITEPTALLKLCNWRPDTEDLSLPEKLLLYMDLCQKYLHREFFVIFQLRACLSDAERAALCRDAAYRKWKLFLFESSAGEKAKGEHMVILDKDLCELS